ncbi:MAG: GNAT family N-acetyltransferase, partial [Chryseobacterium sp.]|nr:GNAT family N-acetyltransferase [Candidatus Chryseobacterium enterohippi]
MIKFSTLENCTIEEITIVFNAAFSDYLMPMKMSLEQMRHKFETENIALHYSVGAFDNDILVGFILHFSNTENGITKIYNGGTGVIKNYRGNNLTRKMYDYVLPLINKNVSCINLEVLEQNTPAINAYKGIGYELKRKLICFQGIPKISRTNEDI